MDPHAQGRDLDRVAKGERRLAGGGEAEAKRGHGSIVEPGSAEGEKSVSPSTSSTRHVPMPNGFVWWRGLRLEVWLVAGETLLLAGSWKIAGGTS